MTSNVSTELSATSAAVSTMVNDLSGLCSRIDESHKREMEDKTQKYLHHKARNLSYHTKLISQSHDKALPNLTELATTVKNLGNQLNTNMSAMVKPDETHD
jgi:hypothetical protein